MNAKALIEKLSELDPETEIFYEVNGDATRTGDYFPVLGFSKGRADGWFIELSYDGYDASAQKSDFTTGEPIKGVVIQ